MNRKQTYFLAVILLVIWLLFISVLRANLSNSLNYIRWFNDNNDRWIYMQLGEWFPQHSLPFVIVPSEYAQIPTYLFGLLYLFIPTSDVQRVYFLHSSIFSLLMLVILFFTIRMLYAMLPGRKWLAYLMFLPGTLYFTYNRFDILPAFLALWSLLLLRRQKFVATGVLLGIGTLTKWYPALLLPVYLSYDYALYKRVNWKMILAFTITCILIALPTILTGGLAAFLEPYLLHAGRGLEQVSLPMLLLLFFSNIGLYPSLELLTYAFLVLQFLPAPLGLFAHIDTEEKLLQWNILVIGAFIVFSRIYSPQWLLWLMPCLILAVRNWFDVALIIFYNLVTYMNFPIIVDIYSNTSTGYKIGGAVTAVVLVIVLGLAIARAKVKFSWNFLDLLMKR
jgi:uncharacterized membrane protein